MNTALPSWPREAVGDESDENGAFQMKPGAHFYASPTGLPGPVHLVERAVNLKESSSTRRPDRVVMLELDHQQSSLAISPYGSTSISPSCPSPH